MIDFVDIKLSVMTQIRGFGWISGVLSNGMIKTFKIIAVKIDCHAKNSKLSYKRNKVQYLGLPGVPNLRSAILE